MNPLRKSDRESCFF